ncbi:ABC transporter substrate-binding protein [Roseivivax sediminis]|uniref:Thiamine pyrimidine synthase n=1 Tax=Roseivivax sediminis TaxID=936889 RepID=A0A1I2DIN6_9RHOB|nr:ABC transporter substrate-binding protein [Roseivivax sediminis]SFE80404.1 ABC-type nitrate/sulfonate/bicarbonate transport system, substrate-binding protein [Roseivivax sediminis]
MSQTRLTRRSLLAAGSAGLGALALGRPAHAQTSVAFQLSWLHSVQFAGSYIAQENGAWAERGLDVQLLQGGPNAPVEPPVISGTALMGISGVDYTAPAVNEGAPFKIIFVAMQKNPFVVASLSGAPIERPQDLVGKRIGMALANMPVLQALCTLNDVNIDEIELVPTQYTATPLLSGDVDCLLCWETDLPVAMIIQGAEPVTMLLADYGYELHSQCYIATEESIANRRDELRALLEGEIAGWTAYREDTDAAAELTVNKFPDLGLDLETQKLQAERQVPLMFSDVSDENGFGWWTEESVARNIETMKLLGFEVTPDLWDRSILEEIHGA